MVVDCSSIFGSFLLLKDSSEESIALRFCDVFIVVVVEKEDEDMSFGMKQETSFLTMEHSIGSIVMLLRSLEQFSLTSAFVSLSNDVIVQINRHILDFYQGLGFV
jgi:hypothetical protein